MAVVEVKNIQNNHAGTVEGARRKSAVTSYNTSHMIRVDDATPDPKTVIDYCKANVGTTIALPYPGREYIAGASKDKEAKCRRFDVRFIPDSGSWFQVDGFWADYPLVEQDEIDVSFTQITLPVEEAVFRGAVNAYKLAPHLKKDTVVPVTNSNGAVSDPTIEAEIDIKVIRVTKIVDEYNDFLFTTYQGAVNNDAVTIERKDLKFSTSFPKYFGRIKVISGTMFLDQDEAIHWRQTIEIHVNPNGWRRKVLDQGTHTSLWPGEVATAGVEGVSEGERNETNNTVGTRIKDSGGYPMTTPVLLDGNGKQLDISQRKPVYLVWSVYKELPFMPLKNRAW